MAELQKPPLPFELGKADNSSEPDGEIIRLKVNADANLNSYAIFDKTFDATEKQSNVFRHIYLFPRQDVKKGEWVRLYSGKGKYKKVKNKKEEIVHCFYWQSDECVWNNSGDTATLIKYSKIDTVEVPAIEE